MKKLLLLAAVAATAMSANAVDFYVIGGNVNGHEWALAEPDCKMTDLGDGVYEWKGEVLGTGFKLNDGTWDNATIEGTDMVANFGSNGDKLELGEPYFFATGGSTGDIDFAGVDQLANPTVTLNLNEGSITVVGTEEEVEYNYYLAGNYNANEWSLNEECQFTLTDGKYILKGMSFEKEGNFKVATEGWAKEFGAAPAPEVEEGAEPVEFTPVSISPENLKADLVSKAQGAKDVAISLIGTYDVELTIAADGESATIIFSAAGDDAVEGINVENAPVYYYNMQGVRVANPTNGIYVKVVGNKALKAVVKK